LFHSPLLFVPTLLSLFLISPRRTFLLAGLSAIAIEATQLAFGYSLDWLDTLDLLCDAIGILLAWLTWRRLTRRPAARRGEVIS
jgi:glycopeptide antibiotics resistance protein